jgi:4-diphosphocytidyl-2-C-methyl-D-erythritol kinase
MNLLRIKSFAKINLALNITGKLTKLHKIESIVSFIDLYDLISLREIKKKNHKIFFCGKFSKNISNNNTISKLLGILDKKKLLNNRKFEIRIKKNIPQEAGLGGGSMNAATLLNYFIKKKFIRTTKNQKISSLAKLIGSDVILGIKIQNTILGSNGKISKFKSKGKVYVLLVKPNFGCSTKYIYSKVENFTKPQFNQPKKIMFGLKYSRNLKNDLEKIAFFKYPGLKKIKSFLETLPNVSFARMTGSGSTIVAYFYSKQASLLAKKKFKKKFKSNGNWCISSKTI